MAPSGPPDFQHKSIIYAPRSLFGNEGRVVCFKFPISREARSYHGRPIHGSAGGAHFDQPAYPIAASANGDPGFFMLGGSKSRLRQGFAPQRKTLVRRKSAAAPVGRESARRPISREARSCRGQPARGSAGGARSAQPAHRCWRPPGSSPDPAPWSPWR